MTEEVSKMLPTECVTPRRDRRPHQRIDQLRGRGVFEPGHLRDHLGQVRVHADYRRAAGFCLRSRIRQLTLDGSPSGKSGGAPRQVAGTPFSRAEDFSPPWNHCGANFVPADLTIRTF